MTHLTAEQAARVSWVTLDTRARAHRVTLRSYQWLHHRRYHNVWCLCCPYRGVR